MLMYCVNCYIMRDIRTICRKILTDFDGQNFLFLPRHSIESGSSINVDKKLNIPETLQVKLLA